MLSKMLEMNLRLKNKIGHHKNKNQKEKLKNSKLSSYNLKETTKMPY